MGDGKTFVEVCSLDEVPEGRTKTVEVNGKQILLANDGGNVYGLSNFCTHDGEALGANEVKGHEVECPRHGARFDVRSGDVTRMPAVFGLSKYETKVEDGRVFVEADV